MKKSGIKKPVKKTGSKKVAAFGARGVKATFGGAGGGAPKAPRL